MAAESVLIRRYQTGQDAAATFRTFRAAVLLSAGADYDREQIAAWAGPEQVDLAEWDARRTDAHTVVAVIGEEIVGFADLRDDDVLDMLFVHPEHGGGGIARRLLDSVKREAVSSGVRVVRTYASRTARPVFERCGFTVVAERPNNTVRGQVVPNYEMECDLTKT